MGDFFPAGRGCGSGRLELSSFKANLFLFFSFFLFSLFLFLLFLLSFSLFFFFANMTMRTDCPTHTIHRQPTNAAETATKKSKNYHCKLYFDIPVKDDTKKPKNKQTRKREREIGLGRGSVWFSPPPYKRVKFTTKKEKKKRSNRFNILLLLYVCFISYSLSTEIPLFAKATTRRSESLIRTVSHRARMDVFLSRSFLTGKLFVFVFVCLFC